MLRTPAIAAALAIAIAQTNLTSKVPIRGTANETACSDAPPCGTVMASADGQGVYSNGPDDQCSGNSCNGQGSYGTFMVGVGGSERQATT